MGHSGSAMGTQRDFGSCYGSNFDFTRSQKMGIVGSVFGIDVLSCTFKSSQAQTPRIWILAI